MFLISEVTECNVAECNVANLAIWISCCSLLSLLMNVF